MSEQAPIISLKNVGVSYAKGRNVFGSNVHWALKDVSFDLYRGETLGVVGKNGAGKSTLLKLLAGIILPDRGEMLSSNLSASLLSLQVGFMPELTGRENIVLSAILLGISRRHIEANMQNILEFSELKEFIDQPLKTYSAGMRARLGFSVSLYADPDILLIDEVLGVGDKDFRKKSTQAMHQRIESDKTIVLVSHNAEFVRKICDRAVLIEDGKSVVVGSASDVLNQYQ